MPRSVLVKDKLAPGFTEKNGKTSAATILYGQFDPRLRTGLT